MGTALALAAGVAFLQIQACPPTTRCSPMTPCGLIGTCLPGNWPVLAHLSGLTAAHLLDVELCRLIALESCHQACCLVPVFAVSVLTLDSMASGHNEAPGGGSRTARKEEAP